MFRLLEAIFRLNVKECVYTRTFQCHKIDTYFMAYIHTHTHMRARAHTHTFSLPFMFYLTMASKSQNMLL